jgi:hypothetical protein
VYYPRQQHNFRFYSGATPLIAKYLGHNWLSGNKQHTKEVICQWYVQQAIKNLQVKVNLQVLRKEITFMEIMTIHMTTTHPVIKRAWYVNI